MALQRIIKPKRAAKDNRCSPFRLQTGFAPEASPYLIIVYANTVHHLTIEDLMPQAFTKDTRNRGAAPEHQVVQAPAISHPKDGGAIRGIGEKVAANPVTGTGSMTVPIATSPGRAGFGPHLALSYDSGAGNGPSPAFADEVCAVFTRLCPRFWLLHATSRQRSKHLFAPLSFLCRRREHRRVLRSNQGCSFGGCTSRRASCACLTVGFGTRQ